MANKLGLFNPSVPKKQLHPSFKLVQSSPRNKSTRRLMNDAFARFVEKDGNFVEQFQTTGFNTRTLELYLSALCLATRKRPPAGTPTTKDDDPSLSRNGCACVGVDDGREIRPGEIRSARPASTGKTD